MGLFGTQLHQEAVNLVEEATNSNNSAEDWSKFLDVCDRIKGAEDAKAYFKPILKQLHNSDPHVQIYAATLMDACVSNCGKPFHLEVASHNFETEYNKLLEKTTPKVQQKLKELLKKWSENEFKSDPDLILIPSLYKKLLAKGIPFVFDTVEKKAAPVNKDPNVVQSQEEQDQIMKAISLSLESSKGRSVVANNTGSNAVSSLYPTNLSLTSSGGNAPTPLAAGATSSGKELKKVRALYDFEAVEENELTFNTGEIIIVLDESDPNWWRGSNHRGEGLFPSNFVTTDVITETEQLSMNPDMKSLEQAMEEKLVLNEPENVVIDENKVDRLLHLLHEADPTNPDRDTKEMLSLEKEVNIMGPMVDMELERVDRKHAQLTQLSTDLVDAMNLYHTLMREPPLTMKPQYQQYPQSSQPHSMAYNAPGSSMPPPHILALMQQQQHQHHLHQQHQQQQQQQHQMPPMMQPPPPNGLYSLPNNNEQQHPHPQMQVQQPYATLPHPHQHGHLPPMQQPGVSGPPPGMMGVGMVPNAPMQPQEHQQQQTGAIPRTMAMAHASMQPQHQQMPPGGQFSPPQGGAHFGSTVTSYMGQQPISHSTIMGAPAPGQQPNASFATHIM